MTKYRIEFSIQRADNEDGEFVEIGFGSSGTWNDLDACTYSIDSGVTNGEWETYPDMPNPTVVMASLAARKAAI